ncbi:hypothetical protein Q9966_003511 [Columba livia]|nr:hypothetical protein Q9966_003511 [Columba livia]
MAVLCYLTLRLSLALLHSRENTFCIYCKPLVRLIKCNPQMADEQVKKMITDFTAMRDKCCKQTLGHTWGKRYFVSLQTT